MKHPLFASVLCLGLGCSLQTTSWAAESATVTQLLAEYQQAGAAEFSVEAGKALWEKSFPTADGKQRSCTACHHLDLSKAGEHVRTGKTIAAMAPNANSKRLTKLKKVRKWLKRNCKWTLGRVCNTQEKGDLLVFLSANQ
ncbi:DUF1924 domain-containing protein [Candidatus Venteria ishoeyi]|uniref:DUF1924 domain-containing protein n=1 Tax=Candidatus Venteria ishoeyi TaxID=1899563 RepID=UPI0025A5CDF0|nr:DUF1924 domain-containing protein [Candidatus Venteria ishoeyi]MDM8547718.1 DUF1924 domain-containing protein [Candidatus Venteria ishoeyi]